MCTRLEMHGNALTPSRHNGWLASGCRCLQGQGGRHALTQLDHKRCDDALDVASTVQHGCQGGRLIVDHLHTLGQDVGILATTRRGKAMHSWWKVVNPNVYCTQVPGRAFKACNLHNWILLKKKIHDDLHLALWDWVLSWEQYIQLINQRHGYLSPTKFHTAGHSVPDSVACILGFGKNSKNISPMPEENNQDGLNFDIIILVKALPKTMQDTKIWPKLY